MKKIVTLLLSLLIISSAGGVTLDFKGREAATVGLMVIDLASGDTIVAENPVTAMIPASILKTLTTASSLSIRGADFRYETRASLSGVLSGTTFRGNIIIRPSGDPTIESRHFGESPSFMSSIVTALKARGIERIEGDVLFEDISFADPGQNPQWAVGDVGWGYGAGVFPFNYSDNCFEVATATLATTPDMPYADIVTQVTDSGIDIIHGINSESYIISGTSVNKPRTRVTTTMDSPSDAFAYNLKARLDSAGISVTGDIVEDGGGVTPLCVHYSPANVEIMRSLMYRSDNMMAEATLRSLCPGASREKCIKREKEYWAARGLDTSYLRIFDGSGLARSNRVTPGFMAALLKDMAAGPHARTYASLFPKVGIDGTVKAFLDKTRLKGKLALKSGSINGVQCYMGYKLTADGRPTHAIVIIVNNFFCSRADLRKSIADFLLEIF